MIFINKYFLFMVVGAHGSVVGWGTMLQAHRSRVRVAHYGPRFDSASNRNEYQESSWGIKGGRRVRLTTLPPTVSRLSRENVGASTSQTLWAFAACYRDSFTFDFFTFTVGSVSGVKRFTSGCQTFRWWRRGWNGVKQVAETTVNRLLCCEFRTTEAMGQV
jgi:hypothetical protein